MICASCAANNNTIGCPRWSNGGGGGGGSSAAHLQTISQLESETTKVLVEVAVPTRAASSAAGTSRTVGSGAGGGLGVDMRTEERVPAVIQHTVGNGSVITLLINDAVWDTMLTLQDHVMARLSDDVTPFALTSGGAPIGAGVGAGADARGNVSMSLARSNAGWIVTLVNNNGVTKLPSLAAVTDASAAVSVDLSLKPDYGAVKQVTVLTDQTARTLPVTAGSTVHVTIPAGDLVVLEVLLS